jgi:flagellar motor component MotA
MANVTIDLINQIVDKLMIPHEEVVVKMELELKKICVEEHMKFVPKEVLKLFRDDKLRQFVNKNSYIRLTNEFNCKHVYINEIEKHGVPSIEDKYYLEIEDEKTFKKLMLLTNGIDDKYSQMSKLKQDIENTLRSLKSYKNIQAHFPEAAYYLPKQGGCTAIAVNMEDLRHLINNPNLK